MKLQVNRCKALLIFLLILGLRHQANAQDTIALKSGAIIVARVDEVGEQYIIYVRPGQNGKPEDLSLAVTDIRRINYRNGFVDNFAKNQNDTKDKIELVNGQVVEYKVVEINEKSVLVQSGQRDSSIWLKDIAAITYANGYAEKYNAVAAPVLLSVPVNSPPAASSGATAADRRQPPGGLPGPGENPFSHDRQRRKSGKGAEAVVLDRADHITLGIGYIIDTVSNISNQFYFYDLFTRNSLTRDKKKIIPVLTLRKQLCDYYLTGTIGAQSSFYLWQGGQVKETFSISTGGNFVYDEMVSKLFIKIAAAIADQEYTQRNVKLSLPKLPVTDFASTKPIMFSLMLNAANYTPPLDDYVEISRVYLKPFVDIDTATLSKLLSYSFTRLSENQKNKDPAYVRYSASLDAYANILPQYPETPVTARNEEIPLYWISGNLEQKNAGAVTIRYLECLYPIYTSSKLKGFLFESPFVDASAKTAATNAVLPLYKRPGTVLTYLQCGKEFARMGDYDAAIESFSSGLLIVENLTAAGSFREYLKAALFRGLAAAYEANNQFASSLLSRSLADFHTKLYESNIFDASDQNMKENTQKLVDYFQKVQTDALAARSQKRAATWTGIFKSVAAAANAVTDAKAGLTTPSDQTNALTDNASASFSQAAAIKQASVDSSAVAAEAFNDNFSQMVSDLHTNNAVLSSERPLFAMDFLELLQDKEERDLISSDVSDFLNLVPFLKPVVSQYLSPANQNSKSPVTLDDVYASFASMEIDITNAEADGSSTTKADLYTYTQK
jgi:tetratricopeptide (TPR) repeat protein